MNPIAHVATARPRTRVAAAVLGAALGLAGLAVSAAPAALAATAPNTPTGPLSASSAGAAPIGSTTYPLPSSGGYYVSPAGSDSATGSLSRPWRTVEHAVVAAPAGATLVLRGGTYHEDIQVIGKKLAFQSYPGEQVWFDGSEVFSAWVGDGDDWRLDRWTARFDSEDPTGSKYGSKQVDPAHPMAGHPEELFVDGVPLEQVGSRAEVVPGTFFVDEVGSHLYLGTRPTGHEVRVTTLPEALYLNGARGSSVRGIGFRRYATPMRRMGAVKGYADDLTFENDVVTDTALTGLSLRGSDITLRHNTFTRNGQLGVGGVYSDDLVVDQNWISGNNSEQFAMFPVAGGLKLTRSRHLTVTDNYVYGNQASGMWFDESCYDVTLTGNISNRNARHGIVIEISAKALVAGNRLRGNAAMGLRIVDTSDVQVWNNNLVDNFRQIDILDGPRVATDLSVPGHDGRHLLEPAMTWVTSGIVVRNNLLTTDMPGSVTLLGADDSAKLRTANSMASADYNAYARVDTGLPAASAPKMVSWAQWPVRMISYPALPDFGSDAGQERHGLDLSADAVADTAMDASPLTVAGQKDLSTAGAPLPTTVAAVLGLPAGAPVRIGAPRL